MDIRKIDKNFDTSFEIPEDLVWYSVLEEPFRIYGIYYDLEQELFVRMPREIADNTSPGVSHLYKCTAGGRARFVTDSPYIAMRCEECFDFPFGHMNIEGKAGFALYAGKEFSGAVIPNYNDFKKADPALGGNGITCFDGLKKPMAASLGKEYLAEIFFPLYTPVKMLYIGLKKGCKLEVAPDYTYEKPVVFYGSSITQGGCASKSCDDYISRLSMMLDTNYHNLGFSGNAKGEQIMAEYIGSLDMSVFVMDYDHNAPDAAHLEKTHHPFYETVRKAHPDTPIIMMTMPTQEGYESFDWHKARRKAIFDSFERAKASGDKNVYLVDCYGVFGAREYGESGTVDNCHPNSLGFLRMAERVYPVLETILKK